MREKRQGARYFYPWDPLQLSTLIESGLRVRKNSVNYMVFRTFKKPLFWTALQDKNFALFYGSRDIAETFIEQLIDSTVKNCEEAVVMALYDFTGEWEAFALEKDDSKYLFTYHPYQESLSHFLHELEKHRTIIRTASLNVGPLEAPNKVMQFIFLPLTPNQVNELARDLGLRDIFRSLLTESARERIYLLPLVKDAADFPSDLLQSFSQSYFLGEDNMHYMSEVIYPEWVITANSFGQELVGFGIFGEKEELVSLHPARFTPSEWSIKRAAAFDEEEALYRKYLASLEEVE